MRPAHARAARRSLPLPCSAGRPFEARSLFSRQRIADDIAPRFDELGFDDVLAHAPAPATPLRCASVGRFSLGEIGAVLPMTVSFPSRIEVAGRSRPFVASAFTTPPDELAAGFAGFFASSEPPPPQPAIRAIAANATILRMG